MTPSSTDSVKHTAGPWRLAQMTGHPQWWLVRRDTQHGVEYMQTPSGFPARFRGVEKARAAIAKATGSAT